MYAGHGTPSTVICMEDYKWYKEVLPQSTQYFINGLTLVIIVKKVKEETWQIPSPFTTEEGTILKNHWISPKLGIFPHVQFILMDRKKFSRAIFAIMKSEDAEIFISINLKS